MGSFQGNARNALGRSQSPYLLQHAANPVDWKEWGEEAFAEARRRGVPVFLSVGYSTCHWCHVMARESFEDEETAELLNQRFVNVKLDREERPDVDRIYMSYVQATTGSGGWPMSVWLTPELKPFYGGTYFPPEDGYGRVGFKTLIRRIGELWETNRATLLEYGEKSQRLLAENAAQDLAAAVTGANEAIDQCLGQREAEFDAEHGGFGDAPKFPMPSNFSILIEGVSRLQNRRLAEILESSLLKMARGGIWTTLVAAFIATRSTSTGTCRTTRRCCTTKASWLRCMPRPTVRLARRPSRMSPGQSWTT